MELDDGIVKYSGISALEQVRVTFRAHDLNLSL